VQQSGEKNTDTMFLGANSRENLEKLPFSRNSGRAERKRPGRGGEMLPKAHKKHTEIHITWINII